jgi:hypothetical protein
MAKKGLLFGVGVNDADYAVKEGARGAAKVYCKFYSVWSDMLMRCYSKGYQEKNKSYVGTSVCDDWLVFSKFKSWMEKQDWEGKELDKDLILFGNKIYSPERCVFVGKDVNTFFCKCFQQTGDCKVGVYWNKNRGMYKAQCRDSVLKKRYHIGYFSEEEDAHSAWKMKKMEIGLALAEKQDPFVKQLILERLKML